MSQAKGRSRLRHHQDCVQEVVEEEPLEADDEDSGEVMGWTSQQMGDYRNAPE
jgi:hypothetical protein